MKVLSFIDDCGHMVAFDVSTSEQELKILEGICKEAAKTGHLSSKNKKEVKELLEKKDCKALIEYLDDEDVLHIGNRGGPAIVEAQTEWEQGLGLIS